MTRPDDPAAHLTVNSYGRVMLTREQTRPELGSVDCELNRTAIDSRRSRESNWKGENERRMCAFVVYDLASLPLLLCKWNSEKSSFASFPSRLQSYGIRALGQVIVIIATKE